jgi:short-subunit dehydrogenase
MNDSKGTAIVTGASTGIGYELCKLFARDGYPLLITSRSEEKLHALAADLRNTGATVTVCPADLASRDAPGQLWSISRIVAATDKCEGNKDS